MKIPIENYIFNAAARTITFPSYVNIKLEGILIVTNVTQNNIIYLFNDPTKSGSVVGNVLTLTFNTTTYNNTDKLAIIYEDYTIALPAGTNNIGSVNVAGSLPLPNGAATESTLSAINRNFSEHSDLRLETGYLKTAATTEATSFSGFYFDDGAALWLTKNAINGSVTHFPSARSYRLNIGSGANDTITRQTLRVFPYFAGNVQSLSFGLLWSLQNNANVEVGYGDDNNGLFFLIQRTEEINSISLIKRSNASGTLVTDTIPQASWNIDKLNGLGPSGITLDLTKGQMFVIDWTWYGFGSITWSVRINGKNHPVHRLTGGNNLTAPLLGEPNQALRYKIYNTSLTTGNSFVQVSGIDLRSAGVDVSQRSSFARSTPFPVTTKTIGNNTTAVLVSLRPKISWKGRDNRGLIRLTKLWISCTQNGTYALIYNPVLTGANWIDVNTNYSFCDYDTSATSFTGGIVIYSGGVSAASGDSIVIPDTTDPISPYSDFSNTNIISLVFRSTNAGNLQFGLNWNEFI